jgi:integrase
MRRPQLRIVEYRHSATAKYVIEGVRVNGKRKRYFFKTKSDAERELTRLKIKQRKEGENALRLSDSVRVTALEYSEKLKPFGKSIQDACEFYLKYLRDAERSISVSELVAEYLATQQRLKRAATTLYDLRQRLARFTRDFGERPVRTITTNELDHWLHGLALAPQTINNFRARLSSLFSYGEKRSYLERNPVTSIDKIKVVDKAPEIFTPDQIQTLLEAAPADLLPILALGAFAGLRTAELLRLEWEAIDLPRGLINVAASKAKTAKRRLIPIAPNLAEWLRPYADRAGRIFAFSHRVYHDKVELLRKAVALAHWPNNGLRHSFASYHLAKHQNAPQLALEMGHTTPRMIFDNYREVVAPQEAQRYWIIKPTVAANNVVSIERRAS